MSTYRRARMSAALLITTAVILLLAACGNDNESDASPSAQETAPNGDVFNQADVEFLTEMIPHHAQAVQMVAFTQGRPLDPDVEEIANGIRDAQVPEVEQMTAWLTAWGKDVPATSMDHANADSSMGDMEGRDGMDTGDMPGMMSADEMQALQDAPDSEFQDMWLEMMVKHHTGAVEMARAEQSKGTFPEAIALPSRSSPRRPRRSPPSRASWAEPADPPKVPRPGGPQEWGWDASSFLDPALPLGPRSAAEG